MFDIARQTGLEHPISRRTPSVNHLLYRYAFRQIPRFIDVATKFNSEMARDKLERNRSQNGRNKIGTFRNGYEVGSQSCNLLATFSRNGNYRAFSRFNL